MITVHPLHAQPANIRDVPQQPRWQQLWRDAVRDPRELLALLDLDAIVSEAAAAQFPLRVPRGSHSNPCRRRTWS